MLGSYIVSYRNLGIFDLTISGEISTVIEGSISTKVILQPLFLLRVGETSSWRIPVVTCCSFEVFAFLMINGMERTLTANYQFIGP
jgi:hypothetical protein